MSDTDEHITDNAIADSSAKVLPAGTVLVAMYGATVGQLGMLAREMTCNQACCALIVDATRADPRFVYYQLLATRPQLVSLANGAAQQNLSGEIIKRFRLRFPPLREQRRIADILSALDDKIEQNRRMSQTIESMARVLFKSWFVDFDPVRAKADGRKPGLSEPLARLFPSSFADSELGQIPAGWSAEPLEVLGRITVGGIWGEAATFSGAVEAPCLRGVDLEHLRLSGSSAAPRRWFKPSSLATRVMGDRDVLIAGSGAGPTGRPLWMSPVLLTSLGEATYSNFCKRISCHSRAEAIYLDAWLQDMRESGEVWEHVNGTSIPNLDVASLLTRKRVVVPSRPILEMFGRFVGSCWDAHYGRSETALASVRDSLLPRLLAPTSQ